MRINRIWDSALPSATPGRAFTASIGQETIVAQDAFFDHMTVGFTQDIDTGAVVIESGIDILALFTLRFGAETRLQMDGNDLIALSAFYYGQLPFIHENTDATGTNIVGGIKVPVQQAVDAAKPFTLSADVAALANSDTETLGVDGYWTKDAKGKKPVHAVVTALTSAASAGRDQYNFRLTPVGNMVGLIIAMPAASDWAEGNVDTSFNRVEVIRDGEVVGSMNTLSSSMHEEESEALTKLPIGDLLHRYKRFDFRDEGFNLKDGVYNLAIDNQDVSDALRIIPVIEVE